MRLESFKDYQQVHIWTGILSGLLLYICFVAGAFTMFKGPLNQWALQPEATLPAIKYEQYDTLIKKVLTAHPEASQAMTVYLPNAMPNHAPIQWVIEDEATHATTVWQASLDANNTLISQQVSISAIGDFVDHLHRTAGIPGGDDHDAFGIFVMGFVCILYFIAIVSGLIIFLPSWFKDLFVLRKSKDNRRFWVDFHNILGISALPFHIVIAVTTIVFAYHDVLYGAMQQLVYKEQPMFNRAPPTNIERNINNLVGVDELQQAIHKMEPKFDIAELRFARLGTPRSTVLVGGVMEGEWVRGPDYAFWVSDPYTASSGYTAMLPSVSGSAGKIVNGFFTLHFGGFGGAFIHWVYFFLGLSGALLFFSGNVIWIESRRKKLNTKQGPIEQRRSVTILARLTTGISLGTLVGLALALLAVKWLPHSQLDIAYWQTASYYIGFLLCVGAALFQRPVTTALQQLVLLVLLLLLISAASLAGVSASITPSIDITVALVGGLLSLVLVLVIKHLLRRKATMLQDGVWY